MSIIKKAEGITQPVPVKWRKHMVLVEWGLREEENLLNSIHRYAIDDYQSCIEDIRKQMEKSPDENIYIIKLVPLKSYYQLPNLIMDSGKKIEEIYSELENKQLDKYLEIWYCRNKSQNKGTVFGRIFIGNSELYPFRCPMQIELVWGTSARMIERYPHINCSYVAVEKENWNSLPVIKEFIAKDINEDEILNASMEIVSEIGHFYNRIRDFGSYIFSKGCNYLSLEFNYCDKKFNFIDWDSDDDDKILF